MNGWDVVTVFTAGHCAVIAVDTEAEAEAVAEVIAAKGYCDRARKSITPTSQIGAVYWAKQKEPS